MNDSNVVLVPLDGSELAKQSIPFAQTFAGANGTIVLLRVVPESQAAMDPSGDVIVPADIMGNWVKAAAQRDLDTVASDLPANVTVETRIVTGDAAEEIRNAAIDRGASLIVITSHARGAIGRAAFGSVADRLSRTTTVPVVIIRPIDGAAPQYHPAIRRLLVPLDGSERARSAIAVAKALATQLDVPVRLLRVIDFTPSIYTGSPLPLPQSYFDDWRRAAHESIGASAAEFDGSTIAVSTEVREGSPFPSIEAACREGDLIVLSSHGRSGFQRWLLGSVAEKLVRSAPAPVCLVPSIELEAEDEAISSETVSAPALAY